MVPAQFSFSFLSPSLFNRAWLIFTRFSIYFSLNLLSHRTLCSWNSFSCPSFLLLLFFSAYHKLLCQTANLSSWRKLAKCILKTPNLHLFIMRLKYNYLTLWHPQCVLRYVWYGVRFPRLYSTLIKHCCYGSSCMERLAAAVTGNRWGVHQRHQLGHYSTLRTLWAKCFATFERLISDLTFPGEINSHHSALQIENIRKTMAGSGSLACKIM